MRAKRALSPLSSGFKDHGTHINLSISYQDFHTLYIDFLREKPRLV